MRKLRNSATRSKHRWAVVGIAAALFGAAALCQPTFAYARGGGGFGGGGGFHGGGGFGGFHGGGFHGGGFHGGGFHAGGFHGGFAAGNHGFGQVNGGHWYHGWHGGQYGWWLVGPGLGWTYYSNPWWGYYPYDDYNYNQPYVSQPWYYCSDPAGYYPYVPQCNTAWQTVPAS
jgi:hypothetical protein